LPWHAPSAQIVDAFGNARRTEVRAGMLELEVNDTPQFVSTPAD
jgi:hypothetical protein